MSEKDWQMFLDEVDSNKDGSISIEEFMSFLDKHCLQ